MKLDKMILSLKNYYLNKLKILILILNKSLKLLKNYRYPKNILILFIIINFRFKLIFMILLINLA